MLENNWESEIVNLKNRQRNDYHQLVRMLFDAHVKGTLSSLLQSETCPLYSGSPLRSALVNEYSNVFDVTDANYEMHNSMNKSSFDSSSNVKADSSTPSLISKAFSRFGSRVRGSSRVSYH